MRILFYFIILTVLGCSSGSKGANAQADTAKMANATGDKQVEEAENEIDFRKEFISLYRQPVLIDTFFITGDKKYKVLFHHFCTMDNGLVVPARYNFDINKDFVTHNFVSDLSVISGKDTVFNKRIDKSMFNDLLDTMETPLKKHATLLYPNLSMKNDSIIIHFSISIPVTDVGIGTEIRFDKEGNYVIGQDSR